MKPLTRKQSRDVDRRAIEELGMSGLVLMENAGRGVVDVLLSRETMSRTVLILCGKGNNGGDGFVIARHLVIRGIEAKVALLAAPSELSGDAKTNFQILRHTQVPILDLSLAKDLSAALDSFATDADWIVDAMLGTGAVGEPREPYHTAIEWMNLQSAKVLAVDVPSGLDCDTGRPAQSTVWADLTCTFVAPKVGFTTPEAQGYLGELHVVSIGIPADFAVL
jgi:NAD(P)H-hydrate epimerase